jgi:membrane protein required for colicin V production
VNWLDIVLVAILAVTVISGVRRGFTRTAVGFVALIAALFCGLWFYGIPAAWVREYLSSQQLANFAGFAVIFVGVTVLGALAGWGLSKLLKVAHLSALDRLAGGAFGVLQGILAGAVVVTAFMAFAPKAPPQSVAHSRVAPYVMHAARAVVAAAPHEVKTGFRNSYDRVKELWSDAVRKGGPRPESHI